MLAGWMAGGWAVGRFDRKLMGLRAMQSAAYALSAGMRAQQEMPELLKSMECQGKVGKVLAEAGEAIGKREEPDARFWKERLSRIGELDEEDVRQISVWFGQLFGGDRRLREAQITEIHRYLAEKIERVQQEKNGCGRLYRNLGVMLALSLAIMLV